MEAEHILCVHRDHTSRIFSGSGGYIPYFDVKTIIDDMIAPVTEVKFRPDVEGDPTFRQLIPYLIVKSGDEIFSAVRKSKTSGEKRLDGMRIIGFGGHANPSSTTKDLYDSLIENLQREISEELVIAPYKISPIGFIYDSRTPVAQDHLGIVFLIEPQNKVTSISEAESQKFADAGYVLLSSLKDQNMEPWTQLIVDHYTTDGNVF
jgi:predicted NUDIX family phosphoesterase